MPTRLRWSSDAKDTVLAMKMATANPAATRKTKAAATAGLMDAALAAACTIGIEARSYFGSRPWVEIEPALSTCWARNYARLRVDWIHVAEMAYTAWSYQGSRLVLAPEPPFREVAS
ncbi:MAG: hypothetical protein ACREPV_12220 [Lysobacter sp.]